MFLWKKCQINLLNKQRAKHAVYNTVYSCRSIYLILSVIQPSCFKVRSGHHKEIGLSF